MSSQKKPPIRKSLHHIERPAINTKLRPYRIDKRRPRRPTVILREDFGTYEKTVTLTFPKDTVEKETNMPKEHNSNLYTIIQAPIRIIYYLDTKKCFVYDSDKNYSGSLEKHDLQRLFSAIGHILRQ